jgi:hypothetical protein
MPTIVDVKVLQMLIVDTTELSLVLLLDRTATVTSQTNIILWKVYVGCSYVHSVLSVSS